METSWYRELRLTIQVAVEYLMFKFALITTPGSLATPQSAGNWSTWSITVQLPTAGQHFIQARATDKANNMMWYDTFVNIT